MPNYNKSFNFRNGVQVDEDNFYINANGLVGIGTTIPRYTLDLYGDASISGLVTTQNLSVTGVGSFEQLSVGNSITLYASSGIVSAYKFYGDGSTLSNIPTSQWVDVDPSSEYVSIYSRGTVGVGTTNPSLPYIFTVGQNPDTVDPNIIPSGGIGINSYGSIKATGIITAGQFSGPGSGIVEINANNISFGTLNNARLPSQINLPTGIATIRDIVVSSGATISGISTFNSQGLITKSIRVENLNLSGVSTVSSIFEISTGGSLKFSDNGGILIDSDYGSAGQFLTSKGSGANGGVAWSNNINITGIATVGTLASQNITNSGITTTTILKVTNDATIDVLNARRIVSTSPLGTNDITRINSGIITTTALKSSYSETGITTSTLINTTNLNVSGVGTITTFHSGNVRLNVETNNLSTVSGDLKLSAATAVVNVEDNLKVDGSSILTGITTVSTGLLPNENIQSYIGSSSKRFSEAHIDDIRIGYNSSNEIDTRSGNLVLDSASGTVNVQDNLDVDGSLVVDGPSVLTGITTVGTGLLPNQDTQSYIGSSSKRFSEAHIDNIRISYATSNEIDTVSGNLVLDSSSGTVQVDDNLDVNNSLNVDGNVTISGITTVSDTIEPNTNSSVSLGSETKRFNDAHIDNIRIAFTTPNKIDTRSGNLVLDSTIGTVEVDDNLDVNNSLNVDGDVYLTGITTVATSILPHEDNSVSIGSTSKAFNEAHIDNLQIGLPSAAGIISTRSGNLTLDSFTKKVLVSQDFGVGGTVEISGITTIVNDLRIGSNLIPYNNTTSSLGSETLRFSEAHIDNIRFAFGNTNVIDTRSGNLVLDSSTGTVEVDDNLDVNNSLNVDGNTYLVGITTVETSLLPDQSGNVPLGSSSQTFNAAYIDDIRIGVSGNNEIDTVSGNLVLDSSSGTVQVDDNLDVNNSLNVDGNVTISGITTVANTITPNSNGTADLGTSDNAFGAAYIANLQLGVNSNEITTKSGNLNLKSFTDLINLENDVIVGNNFRVVGVSTFSQILKAVDGILPDTDLSSFIGSATTAFANAHIGNINIASSENNTISTKSGDLKLNSSTNTTRVINKLIVDQLTELTGIASVTAGIIPTSDKSGYLGSSEYGFENAHINNIRIAVASTSTIDTVSGDLVLQSNSNYVQVNDNLVVGGGLTVTNNISAGPLFVNSSNNRIGVGTLSPETDLDIVSSDENVSVLIKTSNDANHPSLTFSSGSNSANIQFNELQDRTLRIQNQTTGPIEYKLHSGNSGVGTGDYIWKYKDDELMSLTYQGKLGIGITNPTETFEVVGTSTITGNSFVGGNLEVSGNLTLDGDLIKDFTGVNFDVGILTATSIVAINSIATQGSIYANTTVFANEIQNPSLGQEISFSSPIAFDYTCKHYADITNNEGYGFIVYDNGSITIRSESEGSGVGTASTITSETIRIDNFIGKRVDTDFILADDAQVGVLTVTTLDVIGISTITFDNFEASTISVLSGLVFVDESEEDLFVGIGTTEKLTGISFFNKEEMLTLGIYVGISTVSNIYDPTKGSFDDDYTTQSGLVLNDRDLYLENGTLTIFGESSILIGNSTLSGSISISDPFGKSLIGIGTTTAKCAVDFSGAGRGVTSTPDGKVASEIKFMLPPSITETERVGLTTVEGAFIFNKTTKTHQMYDGTDWHNMY
jgi:hypothetical protein